ncbi:HK97 family phage major capsid protein [Sphingomonas sp. F9_3S_D5_B_2]
MNAITKDFTDAVERQFAELSKDVQAALLEAKTAQAIIGEVEQKMASARVYGGGGEMEAKSWGEQFVESPALKEFAEHTSRPARFRMDVKTTVTTGSTSGGPIGGQAYRDGVVITPQRRLRIRDLLPTVGISTGSIEYPKQTTRTNSANTVAEGAAKPESAYGFTMQTASPKVIAHWVPASRQILDDAPQLKGIIDSELLFGMALKEDAQLLAGDGTGENLSGLITNATAFSAPITITSPTMIDNIGLAMLQTTLADYTPTGIVMHPSDWMRITLLKDSAGMYLVGDPVKGGVVTYNGAPSAPMLFGVPVVTTTSITIDKFVVGDFQAAATLYDRWAPRVEVSTEHDDFFTRNLVAILCEERIALAVKQAGALTYGDFGNV